MFADTRRRWLWVERGLLGIGVACTVWWGLASLSAMRFQHQQRAHFERMRMAAAGVTRDSAPLLMGSVVGTLDIPRLRLSVVIAEGDGEATLGVAVGHLPDTPLPWRDGNSALAGHRDTFFRSLQHIHVGDEVRVSTRHGDFRYQVRETRVVSPNELWVLGPTDHPTLTLITCFPFTSIGKAPRRFIVKAERTGTAEANEVRQS